MDNNIKVMGFGTFDGIHPGHIDYIRQLTELGDELCIVVGRDRNVEMFKGKKPQYNEELRLNEVMQIKGPDKVILGDELDIFKPVSDYKPDIIGLGYDQKADIGGLQKRFPDIKIIRLKGFQTGRYKSSILNFKF